MHVECVPSRPCSVKADIRLDVAHADTQINSGTMHLAVDWPPSRAHANNGIIFSTNVDSRHVFNAFDASMPLHCRVVMTLQYDGTIQPNIHMHTSECSSDGGMITNAFLNISSTQQKMANDLLHGCDLVMHSDIAFNDGMHNWCNGNITLGLVADDFTPGICGETDILHVFDDGMYLAAHLGPWCAGWRELMSALSKNGILQGAIGASLIFN